VKESVMEFPAIVLSVCCCFVLGVGVTFALLLLLCCWCAAVGPVLNFTVYCVLLRSCVVCLFLDHRSIISELQAWWRAVLRGWTLFSRIIPCYCCSYRSPRERRRALLALAVTGVVKAIVIAASDTARLDVVLLKPIPCHCFRYRSLLWQSSSRLL
jgi:hypothetical protein